MKHGWGWKAYLLIQAIVFVAFEWTPRAVTGDVAFRVYESFVISTGVFGFALIVRGLVKARGKLIQLAAILGWVFLVAVAALTIWTVVLIAFPLVIWKTVERSVFEVLMLAPLVTFSTGCMIQMRLGPFRSRLSPMERVRQILDTHSGGRTGSPATSAQVADAARILGLDLPKSFREFLASFGEIEFRSAKVLGIPSTMDMARPTAADFVGATIAARNQDGLPTPFVVCADDANSLHVCLNTFAMREEEGPVVLWNGATRAVAQILAPTFAGFLRDQMEVALNSIPRAQVPRD